MILLAIKFKIHRVNCAYLYDLKYMEEEKFQKVKNLIWNGK